MNTLKNLRIEHYVVTLNLAIVIKCMLDQIYDSYYIMFFIMYDAYTL